MDLVRLYAQFDPLRPLLANETDLYVDWQRELDIADDLKPRLVRSIQKPSSPVFRLITGHRGSGKSTELNRVRRLLETGAIGPPKFVSTLAAARWLDTEDVQAEDIVFEMIRQLVDDLTAAGYEPAGIQLRDWWSRFRERFSRNVKVDGFELGTDPLKISFTVRDLPTARKELRDLLRGQLPTLFDLVNEEILRPARAWLVGREIDPMSDIVLIVDQLDRIPQKVVLDQGLTNHESLFLDNAGSLKALNCSVIYTVPIELAYSQCRIRLQEEYGNQIFMLPTIPVRTRDGSYGGGLHILRQVVGRRSERAEIEARQLFEQDDLFTDILALSGGHLKGLLLLLNTLLDRRDDLPFNESDVCRTIQQARADAALPVRTEENWRLLEEVHSTKGQVGSETWWNAALRYQWVLPYQDRAGYWFDRNPTLDRGPLS